MKVLSAVSKDIKYHFQLLAMRVKRMNLIQHCVDENQANITRLWKEKAPIGNIRNAQNTVSFLCASFSFH